MICNLACFRNYGTFYSFVVTEFIFLITVIWICIESKFQWISLTGLIGGFKEIGKITREENNSPALVKILILTISFLALGFFLPLL